MIIQGDSLSLPLKDESVQCCVTSPPYYGLRDYGTAGQIGLEKTPEEYTQKLVQVFREVWRVLKKDGVVFLNLGDSYCGGGGFSPGSPSSLTSLSGKYGHLGALKSGGIKPQGALKSKDLIGIPWRVAFALQADGWWLRQDIVWEKKNAMPESVTDRCTKSHEYLFLLTKNAKYYYDADAIKEKTTGVTKGSACSFKRINSKRGINAICQSSPMPTHREGRPDINYDGDMKNKRSVWSIPTKPFKKAHFAVMPEKLVEPCILAGSRSGDIILDPFSGAGTVGVVAEKHGRKFVGVELNQEYIKIAADRIAKSASQPDLFIHFKPEAEKLEMNGQTQKQLFG